MARHERLLPDARNGLYLTHMQLNDKTVPVIQGAVKSRTLGNMLPFRRRISDRYRNLQFYG